MEYELMKMHLYDLNEDETFYRNYYFARQQQYSLEKFLSELDMKEVYKRKLLVLENLKPSRKFLRTHFSLI